MQCNVSREILLKPLQLVAGAVDSKQTLAILGNLLLQIENNKLNLTGTDTEIEMHTSVQLEAGSEDGSITVPARKLVDICKILPAGAQINLKQDDAKIMLTAGRSKFTLLTLPADDFPNITPSEYIHSFTVSAKTLLDLIERTKISMAQQDVRQYINGMLFEITPTSINAVSTDALRLSVCTAELETGINESYKVIVPRKGILELIRLLAEQQDEVKINLEKNHIRIESGDFIFTSKLIDGEFPDYEKVLPQENNKKATINKNELREALNRANVLADDKKSILLSFNKNGALKIQSSNRLHQEQSEEEINITYQEDDLELGFNSNFLLETLNVIKGDEVLFLMLDNDTAILIQDPANNEAKYVVMPLTL